MFAAFAVFLILVGCASTPTNILEFQSPYQWTLKSQDNIEKNYVGENAQSLVVKTFQANNSLEAESKINSRLFAWKMRLDKSRDPYFHKIDQNCSEKMWKVIDGHHHNETIRAAVLAEANSEKILETCFDTSFWMITEWLYCPKDQKIFQFNAFFPKRVFQKHPERTHI